MSSLVGHRLGDYLLIEQIGNGSMGTVYRASHPDLSDEVAVKVLQDSLANDPSFVTRFQQEVEIIAMLQHKHIVRLYQPGYASGRLYYAMEYLKGSSVGKCLKAMKRLNAAQVVRVGLQAADALAYASSRNIIHRDIKPDNLMVDSQWNLKLLDFGLARFQGQGGMTSVGTVVGSLYYASPEQILGKPLDDRTDVYSLGVSMYEMLSGARPFDAKTFIELSAAIQSGRHAPIKDFEPQTPDDLVQVVARAMAPHKEQRYQAARDLWHDLNAIEQRIKAASQLEMMPPPARPSQAEAPIAQQAPVIGPRPLFRRNTLRPVTDINMDAPKRLRDYEA